MSALIAMLVHATVLSGLAVVALALLPDAPPRPRLAIAVLGLAVWLVPWPWLAGSVVVPISGGEHVLLDSSVRLALLERQIAAEAPGAASSYLIYTVAALYAIGAGLFVIDCVRLGRSLRQWRGASRRAEELRERLPSAWRGTRAEIRVVAHSQVAAASGLLRPIVWIGERFDDEELELVLLHEVCHVRRRDPLWIALIVALRRVYWWNPLVAHLAHQAIAMIESRCDHDCAAWLGKRRYAARLAALMLSAADRSPQLAGAIRSRRSNLLRLRLLRADAALRARDYALIAAVGTAAALAIAGHALARPVLPRPAAVQEAPSGAPIPDTPAGRALAALLRAVNDRDAAALAEYTNAFTPQETPRPFASSASGVELIEVLDSAPRDIRYVVRDRSSGELITGELEIDSAGSFYMPAVFAKSRQEAP